MLFLYNILISLTVAFFKIFDFLIPKLKERNKNLKKSLLLLEKINTKTEKTIWFHSASMGEFEQAKPLIEFLKSKNPNIKIVCTFFSPSGYNTQKNYANSNIICYLPNDTLYSAKKFIEKINPEIAIFVRYELWLNYLSILQNKNIKTYLINATFPQILQKYRILKPFYQKIFNKFDEIYTVSAENHHLFANLNLNTKLIKSSDTRIDRILQKVAESKDFPVLNRNFFAANELIFVAGSVWREDIDIISEAVQKFIYSMPNCQLRLILVPHEPNRKNIDYIKLNFSKNILLSEILSNKQIDFSAAKFIEKVIIVDSIGKLLKLYSIADIAYIGGAFGSGVHSVTEPAGYGIPLVTGTNCYNSPDTKGLIEKNGLTIINDSESLYRWFIKATVAEFRAKIGKNSKEYILSQAGATEIIGNNILIEIKN